MADVTPVNGQITDAVTQSLVTALGSAPASAAGNFANAASQAMALSMENAVTAQQAMNTINAAAVARGVSIINMG
ncbi:MAG: RebB family R body protein [Rhizomicrobium sp.]